MVFRYYSQGMILVGFIFFPSSLRATDVTADKEINALLEPIREKHRLPGLIGALVKGDKLIAIGAVGVRKLGSTELLLVNDQMHLGSCGKAMTATRIALLIDQKKLTFQTTLLEVFPEYKERIHPDFHKVTLFQLLTHRASIPDEWFLPIAGPSPPGPDQEKMMTSQREALLKTTLVKEPKTKPGTTYSYSNEGYLLAASMAERATKTSWESLMRDGLFKPLGMTTAGFGTPGTKNKVDQPWGHRRFLGTDLVALQADNSPVMSPSGSVHCSVPDWAKFAVMHLLGARGQAGLLKPETFRQLHTPPEGGDYAMGWIVAKRPDLGGTVLTHFGSNNLWFASVIIAPKRDLVVLVAMNTGDEAAAKASNETVTALIDHFEKKYARNDK